MKNAELLDTSRATARNGLELATSNDASNKKRSKERKSHHDIDGNTEHKKKHKNRDKLKASTAEVFADDVNLLGTPVKTKSKSTKEKSKKEKKSSKPKSDGKSSRNTESKSGYEEALGISTPSKEIY